MNMHFEKRSIQRVPRNKRRQAGVTLVEFAIVMPFALLFILGIVQLGLLMTARQLVNTATFMAARAGSLQHAQIPKMTDAMTKALIPFYQNTTISDHLTRLTRALSTAQSDTACGLAGPCFLRIEVLNPSAAVFKDYAMTEGQQDYIPNDNLEFRSHAHHGTLSGLTIQDANVLKIKATYGYELKVPLMKTVFGAIMCGIDSGIDAFGRASDQIGNGSDCKDFYARGRVPLVSYATVQMQTAAYPN